MDDIDRATDHSQSDIDRRVAARTRYQGHSATHCYACSDPIPERRRIAIAGCRHCADCQDLIERRGYA